MWRKFINYQVMRSRWKTCFYCKEWLTFRADFCWSSLAFWSNSWRIFVASFACSWLKHKFVLSKVDTQVESGKIMTFYHQQKCFVWYYTLYHKQKSLLKSSIPKQHWTRRLKESKSSRRNHQNVLIRMLFSTIK